ncbi:MAG: hypothetical protein IPQ25_17450 [Chitinophagaceae bacterium]|nr:hypothetical protein [Saprospiraceae bacterium]MBL0307746.1 hypothetical protein [Chitinophagaceae bacterium]
MKLYLILIFLLGTNSLLFSQVNDRSLDSILIKRLIKEGELEKVNDINKYRKVVFSREIVKDTSGKSFFTIIKFGVMASHGKQFFCYIFGKELVFTKSYELKENLMAITSLFNNYHLDFDYQLRITEMMITEIKSDNKQYKLNGNIPQRNN